ncbi:50S ribosomal protein L32e [Candidatus Pacearchaeota archaeon]|nr:MAG: 50S ribosomal protein L32e [Candidatus Pacearchaeota archaeon]
MNSRKKPKFLRKEWHKKIKLGRTIKKKRKWRASRGSQGKVRLGRKGHAKRPKIGWGAKKDERGKIGGKEVVRVSNILELEGVKKGCAVIFSKVGKKKKESLIARARELKIEVLNAGGKNAIG